MRWMSASFGDFCRESGALRCGVATAHVVTTCVAHRGLVHSALRGWCPHARRGVRSRRGEQRGDCWQGATRPAPSRPTLAMSRARAAKNMMTASTSRRWRPCSGLSERGTQRGWPGPIAVRAATMVSTTVATASVPDCRSDERCRMAACSPISSSAIPARAMALETVSRTAASASCADRSRVSRAGVDGRRHNSVRNMARADGRR
jgi:hypothetical protein